jgi:hypothetical protein
MLQKLRSTIVIQASLGLKDGERQTTVPGKSSSYMADMLKYNTITVAGLTLTLEKRMEVLGTTGTRPTGPKTHFPSDSSSIPFVVRTFTQLKHNINDNCN